MSNEENKAPQNPQQTERAEGGRTGRNRRRHRGGKRLEQKDAAAKQPTAEATEKNPRPAEKKSADKKQPKPESRESNGNGKKNNRRHDRRRSQRGNDNGHGLADLYGTPTEADTLSLEELRAKIVLNAEPSPAEQEPSAPAVEAGSEDPLPTLPELASEEAIPEEERVEVIGVRFRSSGKTYYFDPKGKKVRAGDFAIVETARGLEFGEIGFGNRTVRKSSTILPLRPLIRVATKEDMDHNEANRRLEQEAMVICQEKIRAHKLEMKLIDAQYAFDNSKLLFYFTSDGRVDFRELVKDLAGVFRTRIELRQIGIRDEAKLLGGLGACGRPLCCSSFLSDFVQVSIKMAKEQGLSLNSTKISGACGRLMCCLRYESDTYAEEIRRTPPIDSTVQTPDGVGTVVGTNPLAGTVRVLLKDEADTPPKQYSREQITVLSVGKRENSEKKN